MSRVGKAEISIPSGVTVTTSGSEIVVKGPLGELKSPIPQWIKLNQEGSTVSLTREDDSRKQRETHGLTRALLNNCILGVSTGWKKKLELVGVGYRVQMKGTDLVFSLGFSHEIKYKMPEIVKAVVADQTKLELSSIDKHRIGQVASEIRALRPPEPYKGKGIKYSDEVVRRKAGKAGKAGKGK
ncbi:MAG: 50S ribosomal protein L6 [Candidatus Aminicenantes bacterium]|nr:50S ribosomal protein L6 [Candidatus Aminicenantes bacterium]